MSAYCYYTQNMESHPISYYSKFVENSALLTLLEINQRIRTRFPHKCEYSKSTLSKKLDGLLFTNGHEMYRRKEIGVVSYMQELSTQHGGVHQLLSTPTKSLWMKWDLTYGQGSFM